MVADDIARRTSAAGDGSDPGAHAQVPQSKAVEAVGVVGAGRMGMPIIGHLVTKGFTVMVNDLDAGKRPAVESIGARWVGDVRLLARDSNAILVCVGFDREVRQLLGQEGPLLAAKRGTIVAILSTVHPDTVKRLATALGQKGIAVIDSTVCRGGRAADEGALLSFVAGSAQEVALLMPVLRAYSSDIVYTGEVGTAQVAKAVNNLILWSCLVADHEGLALAKAYGVDVEALRNALLISSATNGPLANWGAQTMAWAQDDMAIVADMAEAVGISLPQSGVVREICRTLRAHRYKLDEYGR